MSVVLAKSAGFCYGVRRAVELAERTAEEGRPCVMLGSIIHNKDVIARLAEKGLTAVERPEDVPEGSAVIIRSHGEGRAVYDQLRARGWRYWMPLAPTSPASIKSWLRLKKWAVSR